MSDRLRVVAPPPLIFAIPLAAGIFLQRATLHPLRTGIAGVLALAAVSLVASAFVVFRRAGTTVNPYGKSTAIVDRGPYRFTRNPMYLAMALLYIAISIAFASWFALALLPLAVIIVDRGVIAREERYLERRFGEEYTRYRARVRRWL